MKKYLSLLTLIFVFASVSAAQEKSAGKTEKPKDSTEKVKFPSAKKVFEDYVKASGGKKALEKIKSRSIKGTVELVAMGLKGNFEILSKAPNKSIVIINLTGFGELIEAYDGSEAWAKNPFQGLRTKTGAELAEVKKSADINADYNLDKTYPKAVVTGIEKLDGAEVYVVKGDEDTTFYFDKTTGLMTRADRMVTSPQGKVSSTIKYEDYREVDGTKQAYKFSQSAIAAEFVFTATDFKHNVEIADEKFSKPK